MSLRLARPLVEADPRDIDTETVDVVSAITLDETTSQKAVESQSNGCSFVHEDKNCKLCNYSQTVSVVSAIALDETTLRNARQLSAAELRDIDIVEVSIVKAAYFDKIRT